MSRTLTFCVCHDRITRADAIVAVADSYNYVYAEFVFMTDDWNGLVKTAVFTRGQASYEALLDSDGECLVPYEIMSTGDAFFKVSVFAGNLITTAPVKVRVDASGWSFALESSNPPTPSIYTQILERMAGIEEDMDRATTAAENAADSATASAQDAARDADAAAGSARDADGSASDASGSAIAAGRSEDNAAESERNAAGSAEAASGSEANAAASATLAKSYAVGGTDTRTGEDTDNAKYYKEQAANSASDASRDAGTASSAAETVSSAVNTFVNTTVPNAVASVTSEGTTQIAAVGAKGAEVIESIPEDYTELSDDVSNLKSALSAIESHMPVNNTIVDPSTYTAVQYWIVSATGKWTGNAKARVWFIPVSNAYEITITANDENDAFIALLKTNSHTVGNLPDYATGCTKETVSAGETLTLTVPDDATYLYVAKSWETTVYTPESILFTAYVDVPAVDATLTQSGKAADAKVTGDFVKNIGNITTRSFTQTGNNNVTLNFEYHLDANEQILFMWETVSLNALAELNLYTRDTSSGSNKETLRTQAHPNIWYAVAPTQSGEYLRIVASKTGTITILRANTIYGLIQGLDNKDTDIEQTRISDEMARFEFSKDFTDISSEALDFGLTAATRYQMADKVYAAFHDLSVTYSNYVTEVLDAENEIDDSLGITLTKPWYMSAVTAGDEHTIPIDGDGGTYTYTVANDSAAYTIRMYKLVQDAPALGNSGGKRKIFITSGVHGNEVMSPINLYLFAEKLCNPDGDADFIKLRGLYDFYILPYVNVFGGRQVTRVNGNLTDINRNYPTDGWTHSTVTQETAATYFSNLATCTFSGATRGSEYETQLQMALIDTIHPNIAIDHHNSGTGSRGNRHQFYTNVVNALLRPVVYRAALDCVAAFVHNLPEYFGTDYFTILGTGGSPYTLGSSNGQRGYWMRYHRGYKNTATIEVYESINSYGGEEATTKVAYTGDAFNVAFFTLKNTLLHFCEYDMTHPYEFPDVTH